MKGARCEVRQQEIADAASAWTHWKGARCEVSQREIADAASGWTHWWKAHEVRPVYERSRIRPVAQHIHERRTRWGQSTRDHWCGQWLNTLMKANRSHNWQRIFYSFSCFSATLPLKPAQRSIEPACYLFSHKCSEIKASLFKRGNFSSLKIKI